MSCEMLCNKISKQILLKPNIDYESRQTVTVGTIFFYPQFTLVLDFCIYFMLQIFAQKLYKIKIEDEKKDFTFPLSCNLTLRSYCFYNELLKAI